MTHLTERSARYGRTAILLVSALGLAMVFQPFSLTLFGVGCFTVFIAAIIFNLMPVLQTGTPVRGVIKAAGIILLVLVIFIALAVLAAYGYVLYLQT